MRGVMNDERRGLGSFRSLLRHRAHGGTQSGEPGVRFAGLPRRNTKEHEDARNPHDFYTVSTRFFAPPNPQPPSPPPLAPPGKSLFLHPLPHLPCTPTRTPPGVSRSCGGSRGTRGGGGGGGARGGGAGRGGWEGRSGDPHGRTPCLAGRGALARHGPARKKPLRLYYACGVSLFDKILGFLNFVFGEGSGFRFRGGVRGVRAWGMASFRHCKKRHPAWVGWWRPFSARGRFGRWSRWRCRRGRGFI
jgi:hypothetical protein